MRILKKLIEELTDALMHIQYKDKSTLLSVYRSFFILNVHVYQQTVAIYTPPSTMHCLSIIRGKIIFTEVNWANNQTSQV